MPESSIIITAKDNYSTAVRAMAQVTKSFSKDTDDMQTKLDKLNKTKAVLKVEADKAKQELKEAQKAFADTGDEISRLQVESKGANLENIRQNLALVTKGASEAQKAMQQTEETFRKSGNSGFGSKANAVVNALATSGAGSMLSSLFQQATNTMVASAGGTETATLTSNAISSAISGASIGAMFGPVTAAIGAAVGAGVGALTGAIENFKSRDDAFKSYVQDAYQDITEAQSTSISNGSGIAGSREQTQLAFAQRFGSDVAATTYLGQVREMAKDTNYTYDEITGYSKKLLNSYKSSDVFGILRTLSDASAGLDLNSSDVDMFISGLSRMRTTGKATQEYLNYFSERGVDVYQALANATGTKKSGIAEMVTNGDISGDTAAQAILDYIDKTYGGLSDKLTTTYDAMVNNLQDVQNDMDAAAGEGYNNERKKGIQSQMDWLSGTSGEAQQEANKAIGAWKASLDNAKEQYIRDAVDAAMSTDEYQQAKAAGDAAKMGELIMAAKIKGQSEYNASEGAQLQLESEKTLIQTIRDDASLNQAYWDAGYDQGLEFSKGLMAAKSENVERALAPEGSVTVNGQIYTGSILARPSTSPASPYYYGHAYGLRRVPYDGYPALLHQDEQVLTASEARSAGKPASVQVTITGNEFNVRSDADIDTIADRIVEKVARAAMLEQPA